MLKTGPPLQQNTCLKKLVKEEETNENIKPIKNSLSILHHLNELKKW